MRRKTTTTLKKAIALGFNQENDAAPKVLAMGKGEIAERILAVALANDVDVRKDQDLVEVLSAIDVGDMIPVEAFTAVAEILRYLYEQNQSLTQHSKGMQ